MSTVTNFLKYEALALHPLFAFLRWKAVSLIFRFIFLVAVMAIAMNLDWLVGFVVMSTAMFGVLVSILKDCLGFKWKG